MKNLSLFLVAFTFLASSADAACFADYKAKRDAPLRLHYGVAKLSDDACPPPSVAYEQIKARLARADWTLLNVLGLFDESGLTARREKSAGEFFLRY